MSSYFCEFSDHELIVGTFETVFYVPLTRILLIVIHQIFGIDLTVITLQKHE